MTFHIHSPIAICAAFTMAATVIAADECCPHGGAATTNTLAAAGSKYQMPATPQETMQMFEMPGNKFPLPMASAPSHASGESAMRIGSLVIKAIQGTPGGPAIVDAPVEVQLYHRGMFVEAINAKLDEHGIVIIEDLPLAMDVQPIVRINHADLTYQKVGAVMDRMNREQTIEVTCYELTDEEPMWKIRMRHVMLSPAPDGSDGLHVTEVMMVENLGDRTWAGTIRPGFERPITTEFTLPAGAMSVSIGRGFHDWCCTTLHQKAGTASSSQHALLNHLPIMPGATEMIFSYILPARRGAATIDIAAPNAPGGVDQVMVLVPQQLEATSATGLIPTGADQMGQTPVTRYMAAGIVPGETISLTVTGLISTGDATFTAASFAKTAAAIGVIVVFIGALWMIVAKPARKKAHEAGVQEINQPAGEFIGESI
jgi:hypothetical protein